MSAVESTVSRQPVQDLPVEVLDDVGSAVGAKTVVVSRFPGGMNAGAMRVRLAGRTDAVLKAEPHTHPGQLAEALRARRIVEHMRGRGYPTPAWIAVGATATHVWHLADLVDADPVQELTPPVVEQLMEIVELQAGQASEPYNHSAYAWQVATGQERSVAGLSAYSSAALDLIERLPRMRADIPPWRDAADMVHADLNPSNVLIRRGTVVAIVDIENAGCGTRATDLTTLQWHTFKEPLNAVRERLWTGILRLVGWEGTAVLTKTQILLQLEWPIRLGRHDVVAEVIERGHRAIDELEALR